MAKLGKKLVGILVVVGLAVAYQQGWLPEPQGDSGSGGGTVVVEDDLETLGAAIEEDDEGLTAAGPPPAQAREAGPGPEAPAAKASAREAAQEQAVARIRKAFKYNQSDFIVTVYGEVVHILAYDDDPPRHQRFLLQISDDLTLKIAHNTDLAPDVPLKKGDIVTVKGEYEWNDKGGVIHWTHLDPRNRHEHGYIEHYGKKYE